ncbi:hypothetical protein ACLBWX_05335 [Methylobacterium sp. M6A4_1b]
MISSLRPGLTALTLLRQSSASAPAGKPDPGRNVLLSPSADHGLRSIDAEASAALFSVNRPNPLKEMVAILDHVGRVLGIERDACATQSDFMTAVRDAFTELKAHPDDPARIDAIAARLHLDPDTVSVLKQEKTPEKLVGLIEKVLGLDRLGLSLATVIRAGADPDSVAADTARAALFERAKSGEDRITWSHLGPYRPATAVGRALG